MKNNKAAFIFFAALFIFAGCKEKEKIEVKEEAQIEKKVVEEIPQAAEKIPQAVEELPANIKCIYDDYLGFYYSETTHRKYTLSKEENIYVLEVEENGNLICIERFEWIGKKKLRPLDEDIKYDVGLPFTDERILFSLHSDLVEGEFKNGITDPYDAQEEAFFLIEKNCMKPSELEYERKPDKYLMELEYAYYRDIKKVPVKYEHNGAVAYVYYDYMLDYYYWRYNSSFHPDGIFSKSCLDKPFALYLTEPTSRHDPCFSNMDIYTYVNGKWILDNDNPVYADMRKVVLDAREKEKFIDFKFERDCLEICISGGDVHYFYIMESMKESEYRSR